jgi:signal peptidase I
MMLRNELTVIIAKVVEKRGSIDVTCYGNDMFPFLQDGNVTTFVRVREEELQIGDVCLFENNEGHLLLYRMIEIKYDQQSASYIFRGDTCDVPERPVAYSKIIGKLKAVHRDGKVLYVNHWRSRLLEAAVLQIPFWPKVSRWIANRRYGRTSAI